MSATKENKKTGSYFPLKHKAVLGIFVIISSSVRMNIFIPLGFQTISHCWLGVWFFSSKIDQIYKYYQMKVMSNNLKYASKLTGPLRRKCWRYPFFKVQGKYSHWFMKNFTFITYFHWWISMTDNCGMPAIIIYLQLGC